MSQVPFESNEPKQIEANFRNMIYLMIRFSGFDVKVEHPVLGGRIDVFFETDTRVYIIECKRDKSADEALSQIDEKKYAKKISNVDKQIVKIGANFSSEEKNISEWKANYMWLPQYYYLKSRCGGKRVTSCQRPAGAILHGCKTKYVSVTIGLNPKCSVAIILKLCEVFYFWCISNNG